MFPKTQLKCPAFSNPGKLGAAALSFALAFAAVFRRNRPVLGNRYRPNRIAWSDQARVLRLSRTERLAGIIVNARCS